LVLDNIFVDKIRGKTEADDSKTSVSVHEALYEAISQGKGGSENGI
jgi:hypothetical protein